MADDAADARKNLPQAARGLIATARNDITIPHFTTVLSVIDDTLIARGQGKGLKLYDEIERDTHAYPIVSIEDPVAEDDREGFIAFTKACGERCQVVGDDFFVTNAQRVRDGSAVAAATAVLIKLNQAGTVSETKAALDAGKEAGFGTIVSARSGETEDLTIAHLAVGWDAGQFKVGSFSRSERMAKWNECLRIEEVMGSNARFAGGGALAFR